MQKQKGFTIIELIVVIAIIAVLAAIVLVNVTQYINKGKDAAAEGNLDSMLSNGAVWFDGNGNYTNFMAAATGGANIINAIDATGDEGAAAVVTTDSAHATAGWCASTTLKGAGGPYCVDSTGTKKMGSTCTTSSTTCP